MTHPVLRSPSTRLRETRYQSSWNDGERASKQRAYPDCRPFRSRFLNPAESGLRAKVWEAIVTCARETSPAGLAPWPGTGGPRC